MSKKSGEHIVMNYPMMAAMATTMSESSKQVETSIGEMNKVVSMLRDGGLRGDAGESFSEAIGTVLVPAMKRLQAKFDELQKDINKAVEHMKGADKQSAQIQGS